MALVDLTDWIEENDFTKEGVVWCVKTLSATDTLANRSHQAGPYMPRDFVFEVFPKINRPTADNPDVRFDLYVDSHADYCDARIVWYNRKSRNEVRITRLGGARSALLDPDSTGALTVFAFRPVTRGTGTECHAWVCDSPAEEEVIVATVGWVEPGAFRFAGRHGHTVLDSLQPDGIRECWIDAEDMPPEWLHDFPSAESLIHKVIELRPLKGLNSDERLIGRRDCEYELFRSVEEANALPVIRQGFRNMDAFVAFAQNILQRRRVRSGRSLELHTRRIFLEEGLMEGWDFTHGAESEDGKRPDFLFPSKACYDDLVYPTERLRMLAVKTTCRERWRQVATEADRIPHKHLLTLQKGVSDSQFVQMEGAGVHLVVPSGLMGEYPSNLWPRLTTLESFIGDLRILRPTSKA